MKSKKMILLYTLIYGIIVIGIMMIVLDTKKGNEPTKKEEIVIGFKQITGIKIAKEVSDIYGEISFYKLTTPKQNFEEISVKKLVDQQLIGSSRTNDKDGINSTRIISQITSLVSYEIKPNDKPSKVDILMYIDDKMQHKKELTNFIVNESDFKPIILNDIIIFTK